MTHPFPIRSAVLALSLCIPTVSPAADSRFPPLFEGEATLGEGRTADAERGEIIAAGGAMEGGVEMKCMACHGFDGAGANTGEVPVPQLAGQPEDYLHAQLMAYRSGERVSTIMAPIAVRLGEAELADVAAYYARLDPKAGPPPNPEPEAELVQQGGMLARTGERPGDRSVTACVSCHGSDANGSVPHLEGQHAAYIADQLLAWKSGERGGDPLNVMREIAKGLSEEDIAAVAAYYGSVAPQ